MDKAKLAALGSSALLSYGFVSNLSWVMPWCGWFVSRHTPQHIMMCVVFHHKMTSLHQPPQLLCLYDSACDVSMQSVRLCLTAHICTSLLAYQNPWSYLWCVLTHENTCVQWNWSFYHTYSCGLFFSGDIYSSPERMYMFYMPRL